MQITQAVEPFQDQGQAGEKPDDEQAAGMVVTVAPQLVAILTVVEAPVLDRLR
jgi:hypothetical protein